MTSATPGVLYEVFLPRDPMLRAVPHPIYSHLTTLLTGRVFSPRRVHAPHETPRFPRCTAFPHVYSTLLTGRHAPRRACNSRTRPHASPRNAACGTFVFFLMEPLTLVMLPVSEDIDPPETSQQPSLMEEASDSLLLGLDP
jgi:hypothetical protein